MTGNRSATQQTRKRLNPANRARKIAKQAHQEALQEQEDAKIAHDESVVQLLRERAIKSQGITFVETAKAKSEVAMQRAQMVYDAKETTKKLCELMGRFTVGRRSFELYFSRTLVLDRWGFRWRYEDVRRFVYTPSYIF